MPVIKHARALSFQLWRKLRYAHLERNHYIIHMDIIYTYFSMIFTSSAISLSYKKAVLAISYFKSSYCSPDFVKAFRYSIISVQSFIYRQIVKSLSALIPNLRISLDCHISIIFTSAFIYIHFSNLYNAFMIKFSDLLAEIQVSSDLLTNSIPKWMTVFLLMKSTSTSAIRL